MATDTTNSSQPTSKKFKFAGVQVKPMARQNKTISLLPAEQLLRQLLLDCRDDMQHRRSDSPSPNSDLEIWITEGWVRDKLLGIQTSDIDIALSTMTGVDFGKLLGDFFYRNDATYRQQATKIGVPFHLLFTDFKKTTCNPGMSKKLETAIGKVFGLDIDLVNLRTEVYTDNSRNPQMKFGTAREDAFRRDATVNSLFYDLDKQQVEDFTRKGLNDMAVGIMRTPLKPYQTFIDDPLRVLRIIRFASKLGYAIDEEAKQSMKDKRIQKALNEKVSRERIGIEVIKMMNDRNPSLAFKLIYEADLYSTVFLGPTVTDQALTNFLPHQNSDHPWPTTWPHAYQVLTALLDHTTSVGKALGKELVQSEEKSENLWTTAAYAPIASLRCRNRKLKQVVKDVTEAIRATKKVTQLVEDSIKHMGGIQSAIDLVTAPNGSTIPRSIVCMVIKSWGTTWKLQVLYSLLAEVVYEASEDFFFAIQLRRYSTFMDFIFRQNLQDSPLVKPILNGNDIKELFKLDKTGAVIKTILDGLLTWQFDHEGS
ncbi:putative poly(A) polymerase [Amylocarpus encephaloides]|uniref:Poly(A) polymerase n=1 Tax=Amylocarpus encephaloides TaxID=45428 RepID=A0A9P8C8A3_9HELO|nr:putative poly(A) polymerase [Amylocarpus encephaloides]